MVRKARGNTFSVGRRRTGVSSLRAQGLPEILVAVGLLAILVILFVRFRGLAERPVPLGGDQAVPAQVEVETDQPVSELQE